MKRLNFNSEEAYKIIDSGDVLAFPTETVYGLGIRWDSQEAYDKLCSDKKRKPSKAIACMCSTKFDFDKYFDLDDNCRKLIRDFLPGPLTILIKAKDNVPYQAHLGTHIVGLRIPKKDELLKFLEQFPYPLQVTSANISGHESTASYLDVEETFKDAKYIKGIVEGSCKSSIPTTVVSTLNGKIEIIREGEITKEMIEESLKR